MKKCLSTIYPIEQNGKKINIRMEFQDVKKAKIDVKGLVPFCVSPVGQYTDTIRFIENSADEIIKRMTHFKVDKTLKMNSCIAHVIVFGKNISMQEYMGDIICYTPEKYVEQVVKYLKKHCKDGLSDSVILKYERKTIEVDLIPSLNKRISVKKTNDKIVCVFPIGKREEALRFLKNNEEKLVCYFDEEDEKKEENGIRFRLLGEEYEVAIYPFSEYKKQTNSSKLVVGHVDGNVVYDGKSLRIFTDLNDEVAIKALIVLWKLVFALKFLSKRTENIYNKYFKKYGFELPAVDTAYNVRYLGINYRKNFIKYNTMLINSPLKFIDGVIAHELSHCVEMNHSRKFYNVLYDAIPKDKLDMDEKKSYNNLY